jgi:site-specific DNA recombinase
MKTYFAYIRVSTTRQGEEGVSLIEQKRAILEYAARRGITIAEWFEEQISAAKRGRPVFSKLLSLLRTKRSAGLILHKIDRGARNLYDWATMGELMDRGVEVHFAHESIDLHTRSGRLSADILAVVAADYIRNLREEVVKGINGRLQQGLFPFSAPLGYVNNGKGKPKTIDPVQGPLIKLAFELYASRQYSLDNLRDELFKQGLRTKSGHIVHTSQLATTLRNPFYMGLIRLKNRKDVFHGLHEPLVASSVFNEAQFILDGRRPHLKRHHRFLFRLLVRCARCKLCLSGQLHKGHVYYRCPTKGCSCLREECFETAVVEALKRIHITPDEEPILNAILQDLKMRETEVAQQVRRDAEQELDHIQESIKLLLQKFLDNSISKELFDEGHGSFLMQRKACEEKLSRLNGSNDVHAQMQGFLKELQSLCERFCTGSPDEMRKILGEVFNGITTEGKTIHLHLVPLMEQIATRTKTAEGWESLLSLTTKTLALH